MADNKLHNFCSGPCRLPDVAVAEAAAALSDFAGTGIPVVSISHRSKEWKAVMEETRELWRELLNIPPTHDIVFLGGGASMGFLMAAMNFLRTKAAYLDTGLWASKALKEAIPFGEAYALASSSDKAYTYIPKDWSCPQDIDYLHITSNNTIYGTQFHSDPDPGVPLIADMSSDILTRPIDFDKYDLVYGGAQKNAGPAGVFFSIVRRSALGRVERHIPSMLDYRKHIEADDSMYNTPPVFSIYLMNRTLHWIKANGGVPRMQEMSIRRAELLYEEIDRNSCFVNRVSKEDRSLMNVPFFFSEDLLRSLSPSIGSITHSCPSPSSLAEGESSDSSLVEVLTGRFLDFAASRGIVGIKGHRTAGGFRASIYNACSLEDVRSLISCLRDFESQMQL